VIRPALDNGQVVIATVSGLVDDRLSGPGRGLPRPEWRRRCAWRQRVGSDLTLILDIPVNRRAGSASGPGRERRKTVSSARMTRFTHGSVTHTVAHPGPGLSY